MGPGIIAPESISRRPDKSKRTYFSVQTFTNLLCESVNLLKHAHSLQCKEAKLYFLKNIYMFKLFQKRLKRFLYIHYILITHAAINK